MNQRVRPAKYFYALSRKADLKLEFPDYTSAQIRQMIDIEWSSMPTSEKLEYDQESQKEKLRIRNKKDCDETVGLGEFMTTLKQERKKKKADIDPEYKEDHILEIVNHKQNWKRTWGKKAQKFAKRPGLKESGYRMN
jgi:hypothetical protein